METVRFHYGVSQVIRFQLQDIQCLRRYAVAHPDVDFATEIVNLTGNWLEVFSGNQLIHDMDEHEFTVTTDDLAKLVNVCPATPASEQICSGQASRTDETEFRETLRDMWHSVRVELDSRNSTLEHDLPWYYQPLNQIGRTLWWICKVIPSPKDGLVTVYADGFPQLKCKFLPRFGERLINMFEVVENHWNDDIAPAWEGWEPGQVLSLESFIDAMDKMRGIVNGKWGNWDDEHKVFIVRPSGESLSLEPE